LLILTFDEKLLPLRFFVRPSVAAQFAFHLLQLLKFRAIHFLVLLFLVPNEPLNVPLLLMEAFRFADVRLSADLMELVELQFVEWVVVVIVLREAAVLIRLFPFFVHLG
jgi:hypothetical protein